MARLIPEIYVIYAKKSNSPMALVILVLIVNLDAVLGVLLNIQPKIK